MRDDQASLTAIMVAFVRALATDNPMLSKACSDPNATALLPRRLLPLLRAAEKRRAVSDAVRTLTFGLADHLALRTGLIDVALAHGVDPHGPRGGVERRQLVLLGAGLDARAHRLDALAKVRVFEVDHPATQRLKQRKARDMPVRARELIYVPCDFARTGLDEALLAAGFDARAPSIWIWEGVALYLEEAAVRDSLRRIARLCTPDSLLIATYLTPQLVTGGTLIGGWSLQVLRRLSEPVRMLKTPEQIAALLAEYDFSVLSDAAPVEAAPHFDVVVTRPTTLMPKERIVVATKRVAASGSET